MRRYFLAIAGLALVGGGIALAQADSTPFEILMRQQGALLYRDINNMVKGEAAFDQAKVNDAYAKLIETGNKLSISFPESSKGKSSEASRYLASPKIWENPREFNEAIAKFNKVMADNRGKANSLEELKALYPVINGACNACHDVYRSRKS